MKYALILNNDGDEAAVLKSDDLNKVSALFLMMKEHMRKIYPEAEYGISSERTRNIYVGMHPDRDFIMANLLKRHIDAASFTLLNG